MVPQTPITKSAAATQTGGLARRQSSCADNVSQRQCFGWRESSRPTKISRLALSTSSLSQTGHFSRHGWSDGALPIPTRMEETPRTNGLCVETDELIGGVK
ncbi:unnamed protein product [Cuscuta epithymum]|uniref:Uncharacterized protein n=1 Tax=Cuscuta epithymum TaxID=186058 RepID=A0AAV0EE03_9ASTE|nr:unnamed protein product [Cuscuta epithymum]